jgi:hypothetical protein
MEYVGNALPVPQVQVDMYTKALVRVYWDIMVQTWVNMINVYYAPPITME